MKLKEYAEAFEIFASYVPDASPQPVYPSHEKLEIFVDPDVMGEEDIARLEELGFYPDPESHPPHFTVFP